MGKIRLLEGTTWFRTGRFLWSIRPVAGQNESCIAFYIVRLQINAPLLPKSGHSRFPAQSQICQE